MQSLACRDGLRLMGLCEDDLPSSLAVVSAGIGEPTKKQADGWAQVQPWERPIVQFPDSVARELSIGEKGVIL